MGSGAALLGSLRSRVMCTALRTGSAFLLLASPTVLAFFSGGYFAGPRLIAGVVVWMIALAAVWLCEESLPRRRAGRSALLGLFALTALLGISIIWAPLRSVAQADLQRLLLYLGAFLAAVILLRGRQGLRLSELFLASGSLIVSCYALAARLLPAVVHETASESAAGRLEQPLTYWNASGVLAAVGLLLAARIAVDSGRTAWVRSAAVASVVPFGLAAYLTFSRGALLAIVVGAILLIVLSRERQQMRVLVVGICGAVLVSATAAVLPAVRTLQGTDPERQQQGFVLLLVLVAVAAGTIYLSRWWCRRPDSGLLSAPRALAAGLAVVVVVGFSAVAAGNGTSNGQPRFGADTRRLTSFESNRYAYWKVAGRMFIAAPVVGDGSGSFRVVWRRERTILDPALDAHSLYIETAAELGLLGLLALALFIGGVACAGRNVLRVRRAEATGALAALAALAVHAALDWDWEMPAVAMVGLLLAGAIIAADEELKAD